MTSLIRWFVFSALWGELLRWNHRRGRPSSNPTASRAANYYFPMTAVAACQRLCSKSAAQRNFTRTETHCKFKFSESRFPKYFITSAMLLAARREKASLAAVLFCFPLVLAPLSLCHFHVGSNIGAEYKWEERQRKIYVEHHKISYWRVNLKLFCFIGSLKNRSRVCPSRRQSNASGFSLSPARKVFIRYKFIGKS